MRNDVREPVNETQGCARAMLDAWLTRDRDRVNREIHWVLALPALPFNDPDADRQDVLKALAILMKEEGNLFEADPSDGRVTTWMEVLSDLTAPAVWLS